MRDRIESEQAARDRRIASTYMTGPVKKLVHPEGRIRLKHQQPSGMQSEDYNEKTKASSRYHQSVELKQQKSNHLKTLQSLNQLAKQHERSSEIIK